MATFRKDLELLSPEEGDGNQSRSNKITFLGFKDGDADFNDVTNGIGPISHSGSGLNDAEFHGVYVGSSTKTFRVKITSVGTPDTFQWSDDNGNTYNGHDIEITTNGPISLSEGIKINFLNTTGHTINEYWSTTVIVPLTNLSDPIEMSRIEVNHDGTSADNKARLIIRTNDGGAPSATTMLVNQTGSASSADVTAGGNYTGSLDGVITYYIKVTNISTNPEKWAWSTDNVNYSQDFDMAGSPYANDVEKGLTITWVHSQSGKFVGDIYTFTVGEEGAKVHANGDFQNSGHVASENGFLMKIVGSTGTHLNTYS